jgi:hypothetical protein
MLVQSVGIILAGFKKVFDGIGGLAHGALLVFVGSGGHHSFGGGLRSAYFRPQACRGWRGAGFSTLGARGGGRIRPALLYGDFSGFGGIGLFRLRRCRTVHRNRCLCARGYIGNIAEIPAARARRAGPCRGIRRGNHMTGMVGLAQFQVRQSSR